jgi:hypothetical protein
MSLSSVHANASVSKRMTTITNGAYAQLIAIENMTRSENGDVDATTIEVDTIAMMRPSTLDASTMSTVHATLAHIISDILQRV